MGNNNNANNNINNCMHQLLMSRFQQSFQLVRLLTGQSTTTTKLASLESQILLTTQILTILSRERLSTSFDPLCYLTTPQKGHLERDSGVPNLVSTRFIDIFILFIYLPI